MRTLALQLLFRLSIHHLPDADDHQSRTSSATTGLLALIHRCDNPIQSPAASHHQKTYVREMQPTRVVQGALRSLCRRKASSWFGSETCMDWRMSRCIDATRATPTFPLTRSSQGYAHVYWSTIATSNLAETVLRPFLGGRVRLLRPRVGGTVTSEECRQYWSEG